MSWQRWKGKPSGGVFLDVYFLHLHLFWRNSEGSGQVLFCESGTSFSSLICFSISLNLLPVDINTDLAGVDDGRFSVHLFIGEQSTLNVVYPSEEKL